MNSQILIRRVIFFMVVSCPSIISNPALAEALILNGALGAPLTNEDRTGFLDLIAVEAFRRNGLKLVLITPPAERGLKNANDGIEVGEIARVAGMEKEYPNLIPVPEKMMDMNFVAFANSPLISINGWSSLKPYISWIH